MGYFIPISTVLRRQQMKNHKPSYHHGYPLYASFREEYDFNNMMSSIKEWQSFSESTENNLNRVLEILDIVHENGDDHEENIVLEYMNTDILPCIVNTLNFKNRLLHEIRCHNKPYLSSLLEQTNCLIECDRLLKNYDIISKRYNIDKFIMNHYNKEYDSLNESYRSYNDLNNTDTIHSLCSLIDTYNMDLNLRFSIACESALYATHKKFDNVSSQSILENIIDYYTLHYGMNDTPSFLDEMSRWIKNDSFINDSLLEYVDYLKKTSLKVLEEQELLYSGMEIPEKKYNDKKFIYNLMDEDTPMELSGMGEQLNEFTEFIDNIVDKVKDTITKVKMVPMKTVSTIKEAIRAMLVTHRLQDVKKGVHNSLSLTFYLTITLGALSMGFLPGILALITSLVVRQASQSSYLSNSLSEWREHRSYIERKIEESDDPEKKRKLEQYLVSVNKNIEILEKEYDKRKTKDSDEKSIEDNMGTSFKDLNTTVKSYIGKKDIQATASDLKDKAINKVKEFLKGNDDHILSPDGHELSLRKEDEPKPKKEEKKPENTQQQNQVASDVKDEYDEYEAYMRQREAEKHKRR